MRVPVVQVGVVDVLVGHGGVAMGMVVRLVAVPLEIVLVTVMRVVPVLVRVLQRLVGVRVDVPLAQMQPDAHCHQRRCGPEQGVRRLWPERRTSSAGA